MSDQLKGNIFLVLLIAILGTMLLNTVWPRSTTLSEESLEGITQVAESMKKAADNWEKIASSANTIQAVLLAQSQGRQNEINSLQAQLLDKYGLAPDDPFNAYVNSLLEQSNGQGGSHVSGGKVPTNPDRQLQAPNGGVKAPANPSGSRTPDNGDGTATQVPK